MIGLERVEDQMNVDFLFRLVDDIVGTQLNVGKEYLRGIRIPFLILVNGNEIAVCREIVRDGERLNVGLM
jgi:hypothetical protein